MADTKHTSYRLPDTIKSKLNTISRLDSSNATESLKRLINAEYKARHDEIKEFRENQKNTKL